MKMPLFAGVIAGAFLSASVVSAATLQIVGTGGGTETPLSISDRSVTSQLPTGATNHTAFNPSTAPGFSSGLGQGDWVFDFQQTGTETDIGGGLKLVGSGAHALAFTFLGKEAKAINTALSFGSNALFDNTTAIGTTVVVSPFSEGFIDFSFKTTGLRNVPGGEATVTNGGISELSTLHMAFGEVSADGKSVVALFGDGRGDSDFDDMLIRISVVPLPAGLLLMLTALGGFAGIGALRRRATA